MRSSCDTSAMCQCGSDSYVVQPSHVHEPEPQGLDALAAAALSTLSAGQQPIMQPVAIGAKAGQATVYHSMFPTVVQSPSPSMHTDAHVLAIVTPIAQHCATLSWSTLDIKAAVSPTTFFSHMVNVTESDGAPSMRAERGAVHPA